jgi:uncharacterized delta-60 repeat protein
VRAGDSVFFGDRERDGGVAVGREGRLTCQFYRFRSELPSATIGETFRGQRMKLLVLLVVLFATPAFALTNALDHRFGSGGAVFVPASPTTGLTVAAYAVAVEPDGKIVLGGRVFDGSSFGSPFIGRISASGMWDGTFGIGGIFRLPTVGTVAPNGGQINHLIITSDGHIIGAGGIYSSNAPQYSTCTLLMKTDSDGVLDTGFAGGGDTCFNFSPEGTRNGNFEAILRDGSDGFYLTAPANNPSGQVAHFDKNGALLTSYGSSGLANLPPQVYASVLTAAGDKIIAAGVVYDSGAYNGVAAVRLDADGSIDGTFGNSGTLITDSPQPAIDTPSASVDGDGRLVMISNDMTIAGNSGYNFYRADALGSVDPSFNPGGQQPGSAGHATLAIGSNSGEDAAVRVHALADGRIVAFGQIAISGTITEDDVTLVRLNADASYDTSFGDPTHPGWISFNLGPDGTLNLLRDSSTDSADRIYVLATAGCPVILRMIPDALLASGFEDETLPTACPN